MSLLTPGQQKFATTFARETRLNPRVVGAWLLAEQSGSAAKNYEGKGYHNWLNIAQTDAGPAGGSHSSVWRDPISAGKASAEWIKGQGMIAREYGKPAQGIRDILSGGSPEQQIQRIAHSGWASSGYNGGADLRSLYSQLHGERLPVGPAGEQQAAMQASAMGSISQHGILNQAGLEKSEQKAAALRNAAALFSGQGSGDSLLRLALQRASSQAEAPTTQRVMSTPAGPHVVTQGTPNPQASNNLHGILPEGAKIIRMDRKDQGRDVQLNPGQALLAPGKFVYLGTKSDPRGFGPDYPIIRVLTGEFAGHDLYYGHTDAAHGLQPGHVYEAGTHVATTSRTGHNAPAGWLELGYAPGGTPGSFGQQSPF